MLQSSESPERCRAGYLKGNTNELKSAVKPNQQQQPKENKEPQMRNILRISLSLLALTTVAQVPAHAQDLCIPLLTCQSSGSGGGSGSGGTASAPEISGSMISTGFALVAGAAAMIPRRRRSNNQESK